MDALEFLSIAVPSVIGGGFVGQLTQGYISARRLRAENKKTDAEADKVVAETTETIVKASKTANETLEAALNRINSEHLRLIGENELLRAEYESIKKDLRDSENLLVARMTKLENDNKAQASRIAMLEKENGHLNQRIAELENENAALRNMLNERPRW